MHIYLRVAIYTYNRSSLLHSALESLEKQTVSLKDFEVLIIDNNSSDDTADVAQKFCSKDQTWRYYFDNRYKAKYWHLMAAFDACDRRGISKEIYFNNFLEKHDKEISVKDTKEYKLGKLLLHPIRKVYQIFK